MTTTTSTLWVKLDNHSYPIVFTKDFLGELDWRDFITGKQILIVSNPAIAELYLEKLTSQLRDYQVAICLLPEGESFKNQDSVNQVYEVLLNNNFARDCTLIALGGGVIGDMTGFAAASFMRGVNFIQVPTTLLAQVDSSVGGKTGINHPLGKNMIGAFWQPTCVVADMGVLASLPAKEFAAGMAEVIKYGLIMDQEFLTWLTTNRQPILDKHPAILATMVAKCCDYKAQIVARDEKEQGDRALLNFGHTFGHAIEAHTGYGSWLHGEAVAVGMVQAACLSYVLGHLNEQAVAQVIELIKSFGLPVVPPSCPPDELLGLMARDKKVQAGKLRFIVLTQLGCASIDANISREQVLSVLTLPYEALADGDFSALTALTTNDGE